MEQIRDWVHKTGPVVNQTLERISVLKGLDRGYQDINGQIVLTGYGFCGSIASAYGKVLPHKFSGIEDLRYVFVVPQALSREFHTLLEFGYFGDTYLLDGALGQIEGVRNKGEIFLREQLPEIYRPIPLPLSKYNKGKEKGIIPESYELTPEGLMVAPFTGRVGHQDTIRINGKDVNDTDLLVEALNGVN